MLGVFVSTDGTIEVRDYTPMLDALQKEVGGLIEPVWPRGLKEPYCMIIDGEGLLKDYKINPVGSFLYQTQDHGHPIVGNIVIMKDGFVNGEPDIVGLDPDDAKDLAFSMDFIYQLVKNCPAFQDKNDNNANRNANRANFTLDL